MSKYFTIAELTASDTAKAKRINNTPTPEIEAKLNEFASVVLDPIRERCGFAIRVSSGYRCAELNKAVGGAKTSQHMRGEAADLVGRNDAETKRIFEVARAIGNFDQLLYEKSKTAIWVHISWKMPQLVDNNRHQCIDNYKA